MILVPRRVTVGKNLVSKRLELNKRGWEKNVRVWRGKVGVRERVVLVG